MTASDLTDFRDVDERGAAVSLTRYLAAAAQQVAELKRATYELLEARDGQHLLELGCGTGEDALALSQRVAPHGRVLGVDLSAGFIDVASQSAVASGLPVEFCVGDGANLDLRDDTFDGARVERTLQHVEDPSACLAELGRVVRPGGVVVAVEPDWGTIVIDCSNRSLARRATRRLADETIRHGWIGRQLPRLLREAGFDVTDVRPMTATFTSLELADYLLDLRAALEIKDAQGDGWQAETDALMDELRERSDRGQFFAAITAFAVKARVPESTGQRV